MQDRRFDLQGLQKQTRSKSRGQFEARGRGHSGRASFFTSFFASCLTSSGVVRPVTSACSSSCGPRMGCMPGPVMMLDRLMMMDILVDLEGSAGSHIYMGAPCCCRRAVGRAPHARALMPAWRDFCVRDLHLAQYMGSLPCDKEVAGTRTGAETSVN